MGSTMLRVLVVFVVAVYFPGSQANKAAMLDKPEKTNFASKPIVAEFWDEIREITELIRKQDEKIWQQRVKIKHQNSEINKKDAVIEKQARKIEDEGKIIQRLQRETEQRLFAAIKLEQEVEKLVGRIYSTSMRIDNAKESYLHGRKRISDINNAVAFTAASLTNEYYNVGDTIKYEFILTNAGSHFKNDAFTCPYFGLYLFTSHVMSFSTADAQADLYRDDQFLASAYAEAYKISAYDLITSHGSNLVLLECEPGQVVLTKAGERYIFSGPNRMTTFSGLMITTY